MEGPSIIWPFLCLQNGSRDDIGLAGNTENLMTPNKDQTRGGESRRIDPIYFRFQVRLWPARLLREAKESWKPLESSVSTKIDARL